MSNLSLTGVTLNPKGPLGCTGAADIELRLDGTDRNSHVLVVKKTVSLVQANPPGDLQGFVNDNLKLKKWEHKDWEDFKGKFRDAANRWHKRFLLVPPDLLSPDADPDLAYRKGAGGGRDDYFVPRIECHLELTIVGAATNFHSYASVAYLADGESYRSNPGHLTNKDGDSEKSVTYDPSDANVGFSMEQITLAHEFGHMLGQDHIGALMGTKDCEAAKAGKVPPGKQYFFGGGASAWVCYGWTGREADMSLAKNVMGSGMAFEAVNAGPWKAAAAKLLKLPGDQLPTDWSVLVDAKPDDAAPAHVVVLHGKAQRREGARTRATAVPQVRTKAAGSE